jgi:hypothetical protein
VREERWMQRAISRFRLYQRPADHPDGTESLGMTSTGSMPVIARIPALKFKVGKPAGIPALFDLRLSN